MSTQDLRAWVRAGRTFAAPVVAAVMLTSCSSVVHMGSSPTTSTGRFASAAAISQQRVTWGTCASMLGRRTGYPARAECATILVPIDYADPSGPTASLAVVRLPATGQRVGSLVINPGGPGASGVDFLVASAQDFTQLAGRFDLVGFDPRGIGHSTPRITCRTDAERDADRTRDDADRTPPGIAESESRAADFAQECARRTGLNLLAHVGTADVVADLDVVRAVLGEPKLNYLGYSYGTRIGAAYASRFPDRVRAMVNDGAVDPSADTATSMISQSRGFQGAFDAFAASCAAMPGCPLGADPGKATAQFAALTRPLIGRPIPTGVDSRTLGYGDALTGVGQALYSPDLWRYLRTGLAQLREGHGDVLLRLADQYEGRDDDGHYSNADDAFTAVRCVDDLPLTERAEVDRVDVEVRAVAPFADDGRGTGHGAKDVCAFWPVPPTSAPHRVDAPGLATTLVVSTTNDPATPYADGQSLAAQLRARLVTVVGTRHTASFDGGGARSQCVDDAVSTYLVDLTIPTEGLTC